jgi:hypothetical protein
MTNPFVFGMLRLVRFLCHILEDIMLQSLPLVVETLSVVSFQIITWSLQTPQLARGGYALPV